MKKGIILYMWAGFPQNQFMKLRVSRHTDNRKKSEADLFLFLFSFFFLFSFSFLFIF